MDLQCNKSFSLADLFIFDIDHLVAIQVGGYFIALHHEF